MARMEIDLENTDIGDLFVSVWDRNQAGAPKILNAQRINRDERFPITVEVDGENYYSLRWYAERTDDSTKRQQKEVREDSADSVEVSTFFS